jgi:hypothetical protein
MHSTTCIEMSLWCCICCSLRSRCWLQVCFETSLPMAAVCPCVCWCVRVTQKTSWAQMLVCPLSLLALR